MNDKVEKLIKREEEITERFSKVNQAINAMCQISKTDWNLNFEVLVKILENKAHHLNDMQMKLWDKIKKEQDKCPHKLPDGRDAHTNWQGNDHNWDYYNCILCNHEEHR
jgi:hypothetical protein